MATTHALLILRVFRCFVFLLVLSVFPVTAVQGQNVGMEGCCYEIQLFVDIEWVGSCVWQCQENGEPILALTRIMCAFSTMEITGCREPENTPECPEPSQLGYPVAQIDCDQFGQAYWPLQYHCQNVGHPTQTFPEFTDCEPIDCEIPGPGQMLHSPNYEDCEERGCCAKLT